MWKFQLSILKNKKVLCLKKYDLGRSQYQNKKALFTDPIFSDCFANTRQHFMKVFSVYVWSGVRALKLSRMLRWMLVLLFTMHFFLFSYIAQKSPLTHNALNKYCKFLINYLLHEKYMWIKSSNMYSSVPNRRLFWISIQDGNCLRDLLVYRPK